MRSNQLIQALVSIRFRLRMLLVLDGLGRLILSLSVIFGIFAFLDWWVQFPWFIRMPVLLVGTSWSAVWGYRRIIRPLLASISLEQLALNLGRLTPATRDRLASAVTYMRHGGQGSPQLWERVIDNALQSVGETPLSVGLNSRKTLRSGFMAVISLGLVLFFHAVSPSASAIAWQRLVLPLGGANWPKAVAIEPLTRDAVVAYGEYFHAEMRLKRGEGRSLRAFVVSFRPDGEQQRFLMNRNADGVYRHTFENVRESMRYAFAAGDDDTLASPFMIRVARRPDVASARFVVEPPDYVQNRRKTVQPLGSEPVVVALGSRLRLEVVTNKRLAVSEHDTANIIRFEDGQAIRLEQMGDASDNVLVGQFVAQKGGLFEICLSDAEGLRSRGGRKHQLLVREDESPKTAITEPVGEVELAPRGRLKVNVQAQDDFGITSLRLLAAGSDSDMMEIVELLEEPGRQREEPTEVRRAYVWRVGSTLMVPKPGDVIEYVAEAGDNFELNGRRHPLVRSSVRRIRIVSVPQLAELLRQGLLDTRSRLRQLLADLEAVQDESDRLDVGPVRSLSDQQRKVAARLARELRHLSDSGREVARRIEQTAHRAEMNQASRLDVALQAERLARKLKRSTDETGHGAAEALVSLAEAATPAEQQSHLMRSREKQDKLATALRGMLADLDQWNEFADIVRLNRELLDRQEMLIRDVVRMARTLGGRAADSLDAPQRSELMRTYSRQSQLKLDAEALLRSMKQLASSQKTTHVAASAALDRAVEAAYQRSLADEMEDAGAEIRENRLNRAQQYQNRAAEGLRAMLSMLETKPDRELADLSRALEDLAARLTELIRRQQDLIDKALALSESAEAPPHKLIGRQSSLAGTTASLAPRIKTSDFEGVAARAKIMASVNAMQSAVEKFERSEWPSAVEAQRQALDALDEARELLRTLQDRTERMIAERSLVAILDTLMDLRESQAVLRRETEVIDTRRNKTERLSRIDGLKLNGLAKKQTKLVEPLKNVNEKMVGSVIYRHVCEKAERQMEKAAERLWAHDCPKAVGSQQQVLQHLDRLIVALQDRPRKDRKQFVAAEGGGGGAGTPRVSKPVPTLAELKVLRMLQAELSERTRSWNASLPDPLLRSEAQLRETEELGLGQREIHDLSVRMIKKAASAGGP
ncbi:MAG: hypothetical protein MI923_01650 [Phycisphaerales bacterium]|nr:hypothetical protein [Phycisphaerales bacterium]